LIFSHIAPDGFNPYSIMTMPADEGSTTGTRQFDNKVKRAIPSVVHMIAGAEDAQQSEEAYDAGKFEVCACVSWRVTRAW
jgi:hypothetical protein